MPELIEVELYRRAAAQLTGATVRRVEVVDPRFVRPVLGTQRLERALRGRTLAEPERIGKVLVLRTDGQCLGLRFGMTGVLGVDGQDSLNELIYGPSRRDPAWIRLRIHTTGGVLYVRDPRILGSVELDPDLTRLGPDALAVTPSQLAAALSGSRTALKARLLDQQRLAGVGNLIADEVLWRASLAPGRSAGSLDATEIRRLHRHLRTTLSDLMTAGGSHLGSITPHRHPGGRCPRDGAELRRATIGGRTTWWCPRHQSPAPVRSTRGAGTG